MGQLFIQDTVIDNDSEWLSKNKEYLAYIDNHITNVKTAFNILFKKPFNEIDAQELQISIEDLNKARNKVKDSLDKHDISKYSDEEFDAYRLKYFMTKSEQNKYSNDFGYKEIVDENYNKAWHHHFIENDHHPEHWKWVDLVENRYVIRDVARSEAVEMPLYAILHMLCDWEAMSIKFKNKVSEWYTTSAEDEQKAFNPNTKIIVDKFIEWIKNHKE